MRPRVFLIILYHENYIVHCTSSIMAENNAIPMYITGNFQKIEDKKNTRQTSRENSIGAIGGVGDPNGFEPPSIRNGREADEARPSSF